MNKTALIVDDNRTERRMITNILKENIELNCIEAGNGREALRILKKENNIALIILDLEMPEMNGLDTLEEMKKHHAFVPIIILTGDKSAESAVRAMKMGADDFLLKPTEKARLDVSVRNVMKMSFMRNEISRLKRYSEGELQFSDLIGCDNGLKENIHAGHKAAACDFPVLITGETGTGKEMFARAIHGESKRSSQKFVAVNCGAIPEKLVESTLFGHEKGSFTGAIGKAPGKFQEANGGTIFLDEIGDLPLEAQVKLLRVVQEGEIDPVGATKPVHVNVRILSATNRDLSVQIKEGRFREDLYFRLDVLRIDIPPLRARKDDIEAMVHKFMEQFCATHQKPFKGINPKALEKLKAYHWPGNVRELENVINRAMALSEQDILQPEDLSFMHPAANAGNAPSQEGAIMTLNADGRFKTLQELEREIVKLALIHCEGNISKTARVLGIAKSTVYTKIGSLVDAELA